MSTTATAEGLCAYVNASPSPFHAASTTAELLHDAGFVELEEAERWPSEPGRYFTVRAGSVIAWSTVGARGDAVFRVVGGHTDSPNLRVKQHSDLRLEQANGGEPVAMVALEPYGGAWLNSWLDRDLGISGRIAVRSGDAFEQRLVQVDEPILRVPQLAIHLSDERDLVRLDPQRHVNALYGLGGRSLLADLAERVGAHPEDVLGFDLMTHDVAGAQLSGAAGEFVSSPRLDNQATCYAATVAMTEAASERGHIPVLVLFDHEEVGSGSERGAASDLLLTTLERIVLAAGGDREDFLRAKADSLVCSADMAHATHPNYPDRHEPGHRIALGAGPVLKVHQKLRYASDARGEAAFRLACEHADVPLQTYMHRADLPAGSTIGPITAARTGIATVDVGAPQLAMHSARELMAAADVPLYARALAAFLES